MSTNHALLALLLAAGSSWAAQNQSDERIWVDAKLNGKPARLVFDSGATSGALSPQTMHKLGLKFIPAPTNDFPPGVLAGETEPCTLTVFGTDWKMPFDVLDPPPYVPLDFDGIIGWYNLRRNVLRIDALKRTLTFPSKAPTHDSQWTRFSVYTNTFILDLQVPHSDGTTGLLGIDTGADYGIALPSTRWRKWKEAHPQQPTTLTTRFSFLDDFTADEEAWADHVSIGPLTLTDVPIFEAGSGSQARLGPQYEGTLGLAALKRVELVVDGSNQQAYLRPVKTRTTPYQHNRLGAVFVPSAGLTNRGVARVIEGGPAYQAGVRNGDVLVQVDDVTVSSWSESWLRRFKMPAGTKLKLTLMRDGKTFSTTAVLRQILQPTPERRK